MNFKTYKYCVGEVWDEKDLDQITILGDYYSAAEEAVEHYEVQSAEYNDNNEPYTVWVMEVTHTIPRKFIVYAEATRTYSANEAK